MTVVKESPRAGKTQQQPANSKWFCLLLHLTGLLSWCSPWERDGSTGPGTGTGTGFKTG